MNEGYSKLKRRKAITDIILILMFEAVLEKIRRTEF
jgi:hypothetical protein